MMRKYQVRFGGGVWKRARKGTSLDAYPTGRRPPRSRGVSGILSLIERHAPARF